MTTQKLTTEELKNFIKKCLTDKNGLHIRVLAIVLEDNIASCISIIKANPKQKSEYEKMIKYIDGKVIQPFQLQKMHKYFCTHGFNSSIENNILIIKK